MGRPSLKAQRRDDLIRACMKTIQDVGLDAASLAQIAKRAGLSASIVSHYFADKAELMEATMRTIGGGLGRQQVLGLRTAQTPMDRLKAILAANLGPEQFRPDTTAAWLAFWARVNHAPRLAHIQHINRSRLISNLRHALRGLLAEQVPALSDPRRTEEVRRIATALSTLIDGAWLHAALNCGGLDPAETQDLAMSYVTAELHRLKTLPEGS